jgi:galactokinase
MAIDRAAWIALRPRDDRRVRVYSLDYDEMIEFGLDTMQKGKGWGEYIKGIAWVLEKEGNWEVKGWEGSLGGDVPKGAGLSSSAGVELAAARAFAEVSGIEWNPAFMAQIGQKAENYWVGVNCGIMDQVVSAAAQAGHALFLDCRSLEYEYVPLPDDVAVVVMDTSTRRGLVDSAYNERRSQCEAGAAFFGVKALRDVSLKRFENESGNMKDKIVMRRARHIVSENQRVLDAVTAMRAGDVGKLGSLFNESHVSLRDDFEVTNDALNQIVEAAQTHPACYGTRMTGAGFGGCAVALVKQNQVESFVSAVMAEYRQTSGLEAEMYVCQPSEGASSLKI